LEADSIGRTMEANWLGVEKKKTALTGGPVVSATRRERKETAAARELG
jgi:hypothetical protein